MLGRVRGVTRVSVWMKDLFPNAYTEHLWQISSNRPPCQASGVVETYKTPRTSYIASKKDSAFWEPRTPSCAESSPLACRERPGIGTLLYPGNPSRISST